MDHLIMEFVQLLKGLSYFGILLALSLECVPAELILPLAGYWVYEGELNLWLAVLAGTAGGTIGPVSLYWLGRWGGRPFVEKYGKYFFVKEKQMQEADLFFKRHGGMVAFSARFLPGLRTVISIPCGVAKMNVWAFAGYTFAAMLPITFFYVYLGYKFGPQWEAAGELATVYLPLILAGIFVLIIPCTLIKRKKKIVSYSLKQFKSKKR